VDLKHALVRRLHFRGIDDVLSLFPLQTSANSLLAAPRQSDLTAGRSGSLQMNPYITWPRSAKVAVTLFMVIATGFLLIAAKAILIPVALAVLISFVLHPVAKRLQRWGANRIVAVLTVVISASIIVGGIGFVVSSQLKSFADQLPSHSTNIEEKVLAVKSMLKGGTIDKLSAMFQTINQNTEQQLDKAQAEEEKAKDGSTAPPAPRDEDATATARTVAAAGKSVLSSVRTQEPVAAGSPDEPPPAQPAAPLAAAESGGLMTTMMSGSPIISSALDVLATSGLVILLVTFFLVQQADVRDRIVSVAGRGALATTTKALEDAGSRISRYLLMLFVVNSTFGIAVAVGLALMGVPYAIMWGLAAGSLRYIPYIGPWIAAVMPITVSLATSPGWSQPLMVVGLFVVLELLSNNVMEPVLYGQSVGISELGVILSAVIWAWLWGPIGLVLATPMSVCLVVLGRYVPGLRIFDHLLGDRAAVHGSVRLYQRLLAKDAEDAEELIERHLKDHSLAETADELIVPAIELVRQDLVHEQIDDEDADRMVATFRGIIESLAAEMESSPGAAERPAEDDSPVVMGVAAHAQEEVILLELLNVVCAGTSCRIQVLSSDLLQSERLAAIEEQAPELVIVSSLPPGDLPYARQICKRLKTLGTARRIVVARWGAAATTDRSQQLLAAGADEVVTTVSELERMVKTEFHMHQASNVPASSVAASASPSRPTKVQAT
jgi:predicted PurR-regulated permease PerM